MSALNSISIFLTLTFSLLIASCGGGGGGSNADASPRAPDSIAMRSLLADTTPINLAFVQGRFDQELQNPNIEASLRRLITITGIDLDAPPEDFELAYFSDSETDRQGLAGYFTQISNASVLLQFRPNGNLQPGKYTGSFTLVACFLNTTGDDCREHISGSPSQSIPYSVIVYPVLYLPGTYEDSFYANQGRKAFITSTFVVAGTISKDDLLAETSYSPTAANWLNTTRTDSGYDYAIKPESLLIGSHTATIKISSKESSQIVYKTVRITVGTNTYASLPTDQTLIIDDFSTDQNLKSEFVVNLEDTSLAAGWKAQTNVPWIVIDTPFGTTSQSLTYRISKSHLSAMPTKQAFVGTGVLGSITIVNDSTYTVAPFSITINLSKQISDISKNLGPSLPIKSPGYKISLSGKNLSADTVYATAGPSPFAASGDGTISTAPSTPGAYSIRTQNALGLATTPVTLTFLANVEHSYRFLPLSGYNRSFAYDHARDSLYVADKTRNQLVRFQHASGVWTETTQSIPNISDLGISKDGKRLFVSRTSGVLHRIDPDDLTVNQTMTFGQPFPEYRQLSQNLPVLGVERDYVSMMTNFTASGFRELSGITTWSSQDNAFLPTQGYGYKPERGGWFAKSNLADAAYFTQALPRESEYGIYAGVFSGLGLTPSAYLVSYQLISPFSTFDTGLTSTIRDGVGMLDRKTIIGYYSAPIPSIPAGDQIVGSIISADWQYAYLLAYPTAAINGDLSTTIKPRIYTYKLDLENFPMIQLLPGYKEINDFPTCRRSDATCLIDTTSAVSMDGKTLFFAGDKGIVVVPDPAPSRLQASAAKQSVVRIQPAQTKTIQSQKVRINSIFTSPKINQK